MSARVGSGYRLPPTVGLITALVAGREGKQYDAGRSGEIKAWSGRAEDRPVWTGDVAIALSKVIGLLEQFDCHISVICYFHISVPGLEIVLWVTFERKYITFFFICFQQHMNGFCFQWEANTVSTLQKGITINTVLTNNVTVMNINNIALGRYETTASQNLASTQPFKI